MPGIFALIALLALVLTVANAVGKCPVWAPLFLVSFLLLFQYWK